LQYIEGKRCYKNIKRVVRDVYGLLGSIAYRSIAKALQLATELLCNGYELFSAHIKVYVRRVKILKAMGRFEEAAKLERIHEIGLAYFEKMNHPTRRPPF
jgi:hypothetical protein